MISPFPFPTWAIKSVRKIGFNTTNVFRGQVISEAEIGNGNGDEIYKKSAGKGKETLSGEVKVPAGRF
jgi:hypothetical protein